MFNQKLKLHFPLVVQIICLDGFWCELLTFRDILFLDFYMVSIILKPDGLIFKCLTYLEKKCLLPAIMTLFFKIIHKPCCEQSVDYLYFQGHDFLEETVLLLSFFLALKYICGLARLYLRKGR